MTQEEIEELNKCEDNYRRSGCGWEDSMPEWVERMYFLQGKKEEHDKVQDAVNAL